MKTTLLFLLLSCACINAQEYIQRANVDGRAIAPSSVALTSTYLPTSVGGLSLWLEPEKESVAVGSTLTVPVDQSGNNRTCVFNSAVTVVNGSGGRKAWSMTGQKLTVTVPTTFRSATLVVVMRSSKKSTTQFVADATTTSPYWIPQLRTGEMDHYSSDFSLSTPGVNAIQDEFQVLTWVCGASDTKLRINGVELAGAVVAAGTSTTLEFFAVPGYVFGGQVEGIYLYDSALSAGDLAKIEDYCFKRFALPQSISADANLVVFEGDSLTHGYGSTASSKAYPAQVASMLKGIVPRSLAVESATWANIAARRTRLHALLSQSHSTNTVVFWAGTNDLVSIANPATTYAASKVEMLAAKKQGAKVIFLNILPRNPDINTDRATLNALWAADFNVPKGTRVYGPAPGVVYADYYVAISENPHIGDDGDNTDTDYYFDLTHLTDLGYSEIATDVVTALKLP